MVWETGTTGKATSTVRPAAQPQNEDSGDDRGFFGRVGDFFSNNITVGDAIGAALTAGSIYYQIRSNKKQKKRLRQLQDNLRGSTVRFQPVSGNVPIAVGFCGIPAVPIFTDSSRVLPMVPMSDYGTLEAMTDPNKFLEYLLVQYALCASPIDAISDLYINGDPWKSIKLPELFSHEILEGEVSASATAFTRESGSGIDRGLAKGTGLVHLTGFYDFNQDGRIIAGIPDILLFARGIKVRNITKDGFSDERSFRTSLL